MSRFGGLLRYFSYKYQSGPVPSVVLPEINSPSSLLADYVRGKHRYKQQLTYPSELQIEDRVKNGVLRAGITSTVNTPYVFASNLHNEAISCTNRHMTPKEDCYTMQWAHFYQWVFANIDYLLPDCKMQESDWLTFNQWNQRFPASARAIHQKTLLKLKAGVFLTQSKLHSRSSFVKREKTLKYPPGDPRLIQGASDPYKVLVSPWVISLSNKLKKIWNSDHFIYYTSGANANALGRWYDAVFNRPGLKAVSTDGSRWDAHMSRLIQYLELDVYKYMGLPHRKYKLMRDAIKKRGVTKNGLYYVVDGTRASGDPNTSCGNSLINGLMHCYQYCMSSGNTPEILYRQSQIFRASWCAAVLGDDNACAMHELDIENFQSDVHIFNQLGFKMEINVHKHLYQLDYCSGRFYPSTVGTIWAPSIGRMLSKAGWFLHNNARMDGPALNRAMALSFYKDVQHVPILCEYINKLYDLTAGVRPDIRLLRELQSNRAHVEVIGKPIPDSFRFMEEVYGLVAEPLVTLKWLINGISQLPYQLTHPAIEQFVLQDCE